MEMPIHVRAGADEDGRVSRGQRVTANRDAAYPGAGENADADGCRPPSRDARVGGIDEGFRSRRRSRLPPSGNSPCIPRGKPAHPPPRRCYHAPLSRDPLRPARPATSCSPLDERQCRSRVIMAASCRFPLVSAPVLPVPTRCRTDTPPPVNKIIIKFRMIIVSAILILFLNNN